MLIVEVHVTQISSVLEGSEDLHNGNRAVPKWFPHLTQIWYLDL